MNPLLIIVVAYLLVVVAIFGMQRIESGAARRPADSHRVLAEGVIESIRHTTPGRVRAPHSPWPALFGWLAVIAISALFLFLATGR